MTGFRPGNLNLGVIFCVESDDQVEQTPILHLNLYQLRKRDFYQA